MNLDDDPEQDTLARIDLHVWRVPPPPPDARPAILSRVLAPAISPKRPRIFWMVAALAVANVVLVAIVVVVLSRPESATTITIQPAGGGSLDAQVREVLRQLDHKQHELEGRLADVEQLRTVVEQLSDKVRECEQTNKQKRPEPPEPPGPAPQRVDDGPCDEVSCVLQNNAGTCCAKFRSSEQAALDRQMISAGVAAIRDRILACHGSSSATGVVKIRVRVEPSGRVNEVVVATSPDPALGACVQAAVRDARFPATQSGGSFSYPFVF